MKRDESDRSSLFSRGRQSSVRNGVDHSSSSLSLQASEGERPVNSAQLSPSRPPPPQRHYSFAEHQEETAASSEEERGETGGSSSVPAEQERQLLLLMLLAQVCALHDPTPRTFTVHVLELFERGILDRQSILFLFELGLVPSISPSKLILCTPDEAKGVKVDDSGEQLSCAPTINSQNFHVRRRAVEASAIRTCLEQQETQHKFHKSHSEPIPQRQASWSAKHHPLSLSRYQREFQQIRLLSSGAFGQVFQATSNMDGRDYAIKRIPFSATGYSRESVQQVVREVHCLASCDHPNVVRYYTSWLEPSWMTGSGAISVVDVDKKKLLEGINPIVSCASDDSSLDESGQDNFPEKRTRRSFSFDAAESSWNMKSDWNDQSSFSKDDLFAEDIFDRSEPKINEKRRSPPSRYTPQRQQQRNNYRYQICLFIQMQLCHPSTLADWIRQRNHSHLYTRVKMRLFAAEEIFRQIARGLSHVHGRDILHRDLKPANIFAIIDGQLQFKIGDFGLSKMMLSSSVPKRTSSESAPGAPLLLASFEDLEIGTDVNQPSCAQNKASVEHLTAGVGTASYASPEQTSSKKYGKTADIFSLGLILLELVCGFETEHERYQVFQDCRHKRKVPDEVEMEAPFVAKIILSCTEPIPENRPSSDQLIDATLQGSLEDEKVESPQHTKDLEPSSRALGTDEQHWGKNLEDLLRELAERDRIIRDLETKIVDKDRIISDLQAENSRLQASRASQGLFTYPMRQQRSNSDRERCSSSSSSSDNEI